MTEPRIERRNKSVKVSQYIKVRINSHTTWEQWYEVIFDFSTSELSIKFIPRIRGIPTEFSGEDTIQLKEKYVIKSVDSPDRVFLDCAVEIFKNKIK